MKRFIAAGLLVLLWCKDLPVPRALRVPISAVAAASIWIFISHFRVFPPLSRNLPLGVAYALTIAAGIALAGLVAVAGRQMRALVQRWRSEDDCPVAVGEDPVLEVGAHGAGQHHALEVVPPRASRSTSSRWLTGAVVLVDDRALVEVVGGVVGGRADQLDAAARGPGGTGGRRRTRAGTSGGC